LNSRLSVGVLVSVQITVGSIFVISNIGSGKGAINNARTYAQLDTRVQWR